jgi:hypothetical protein
VAGHGDLHAAAHRVAVDRGDHRLRKTLDLAHHAVAEADEGLDVAAGKRRAEVGAAAEDPVAGAGDDDRAHAVVVAHGVQRVVQLADERLADGVGGRAVERDDGVRLLARQHERFKSHRGSLL